MKSVIIVLIILIIFQMGIIFFLLKTRKEINKKYQSNLHVEKLQYVKEWENVQKTMDSIISSANTIHLYTELIGENISSESARNNINIVIAEIETIEKLSSSLR